MTLKARLGRKRLGREIGLLMLPLLFLGGIGWWQNLTSAETPASKKPLNPGSPSLKHTPFRKMEMTPFDVWSGYSAGVETDITTGGRYNVPGNWRQIGSNVYAKNVAVVYRLGANWKVAPQLKSGRNRVTSLVISSNAQSPDTIRLRVSFQGIPTSAAEVKLRGALAESRTFSGTVPAGWKFPKATVSTGKGTQHILQGGSKPFSVSLKASHENWPPPVRRQSTIQLRGQAYQIENIGLPGGQLQPTPRFLVSLHHPENPDFSQGAVTLRKLHVFDAKEKEIDLYWGYGAGPKIPRGWGFAQELMDQAPFKSIRSGNDLVTNLVGFQIAPKLAWNKYPQPLRFEVDISDGKCWPTHASLLFDLRKPPLTDLKNFKVSPPKLIHQNESIKTHP